jgi:hypothetical protein
MSNKRTQIMLQNDFFIGPNISKCDEVGMTDLGCLPTPN